MPRGDGTGPWGQGSMTGRGAGFCGGFGTPEYANPVPGRGFGRGGRGGGRGRERASEVAAAEAGETCTGPGACRAGRALDLFPVPVEWVPHTEPT